MLARGLSRHSARAAARPPRGCALRAVDHFQELQEIALNLHTAFAQRIAKGQIDVGQELPERAAVVDYQPGLGRSVAVRLAVPKHQPMGGLPTAPSIRRTTLRSTAHTRPLAWPGAGPSGLRDGLPDHSGGNVVRVVTEEPIRDTSHSAFQGNCNSHRGHTHPIVLPWAMGTIPLGCLRKTKNRAK